MTQLLIVVGVVSAALVLGALWGLYGPLTKRFEGMIVGLAAGALLISLVMELIEPAIEKSTLLTAILGVTAGAGLFAVVDYLIDEKWGSQSGGGMLAAVTLDGIPENIALGVALIGAGASEVAALAISILLSNLPEAASGARSMRDDNQFGNTQILGIWAATAAILAASALLGNWYFARLQDDMIAFVSCLAAGAVAASLTTEIMPKAHREAPHWAGFMTALGLLLALVLHEIGGGSG